MPQDTENKNLCKHTQDAQKFLVTPTKKMAYIQGTATKMTVCIDNVQHPLIIENGVHFSIVARNYLDHDFPNWEKQIFPTKAKSFQSTSGNITSIGKIIKYIIITHRKGNIRLDPEFVVLEDAHIQGFLLGIDYQRVYGIDIYYSKNRHITISTNKEKKLSIEELLALGHKVLGLSLAIDQSKVAAVLLKPVPNSIKEMQYFLEFSSYYKNHIRNVSRITSSQYMLYSKDVVFEITKERRDAYKRIKQELTNAPVLILTDFELPFNLYIDAACIQGLGSALHQRQIVDGEPREGVICYISRQLKDS
ncbi:hypothetical protein O181_024352 [Austropuccinia psidii MF-1]|uniref:Reverse transcriptase/retrotransposon-derived protein RNase H-like domain-containing protein n=1 Tax=Austropuccinia psidii MF-1 TaxID=1389203 RepID=A0A9Q3CLD3_9BASI|nr:hypothetical protein [Austropuccinia psidii MF-1]